MTDGPCRRLASVACAAVAVCVFASVAWGQWITFNNETATRLAPEPGFPYNPSSDNPLTDTQEKDYGVGDFDDDGDTDMVVVRKQPLTTTGKQKAYLFMNEGGVLTNRTNTLAPDMLTPCNNRDVEVVDVDGDDWLDLVTAPTRPVAGDLHSVKQPRVYMNLGDDANGNWLGFDYNHADQRIPNFSIDPFFCSIVSGDLDGDGDPDLFFTDYAADSSVADPPGGPLFNRIMFNDGNGFFTDVTQSNMINSGAAAMLGNGFGTNGDITDLDNDNDLDIMANDSCSADPRTVRFARNNGSGVFNATSNLTVGFAVYHTDNGDLNQDGKMDFYTVDDGSDRVFLGSTISGGMPTFTNVSVAGQTNSTTSGFGGNVYLVDLDNDNRLDAVVADEDVDLPQGGNRMALFHGIPSSPWLSASGAANADPFILGGTACTEPMCTRDTFDVAILDINGDDKLDLVVGTDTGTKVFMQPPPADMVAPTIVSTTPVNGTKDGLQDRNSVGTLQGINQVVFTFSEPVRDAATNGAVSAASFSISLTTNLPGLTPPTIASVVPSGNTYTLNLSTPIKPGAWNTFTANVEDLAGNALGPNALDLGFLPGDATGTGSVNTQDILGTIAGINACTSAGTCGTPAVLAQYDMDRNGVMNTQDLLRLIQLLNGVNTQNAWNGVTLPPQP